MRSADKRGKKRWVVLGLVGLSAVPALWFLTHLSMDSLLARAVRVGIVTDRDDGFWMSSHEFATVTSDTSGRVRGILHDVATGKQRSVDVPAAVALQARGDIECAIESLTPGHKVQVTTWDKPTMDQALANGDQVRLAGIRFGRHDYYGPVISGQQPHRSGIVTTLEPRHVFSMHLPPGTPDRAQILFSARGDRWAVAVSRWRTPGVPLWLRSLLPFLNDPWGRKHYTEVYTGDARGGATRLLGSVWTTPESMILPTQPPDSEERLMRSLQWLPDGKHLSFVYDNALYTVPAN